MTTQEEFFASGPVRDPERVDGRYKFVDPFGNQVSAMTASNYGFPLADQYGLNKWKMRELVKGIAARPDLYHMVSTMDAGDVGKIDEVIDTALAVAGTSAKANTGTAIHGALQLSDQGESYPEWAEPYVQSYRAELLRYGLRVGLIEADVYSPGLGARGRLDRTFIESDGGHVLGDVKSTGHLELQAHEISVQMAVYQSATHYRDDKGAWHAIPRGKHPLRDDYAIIVHVDQEHATVSLYRLDLWIGKRGANLAEQVRQWRKSGPVLLPYVPPDPRMAGSTPITPGQQPPPAMAARMSVPRAMTEATPGDPMAMAATVADGEIERAGSAETMAWLNQANPSMGQPVTDGWSPTVSDAPPAPEPGQGASERTTAQAGTEPASDSPPAQPTASMPPLRTATDLLRASVTKAQCQQYAREHGITDLAHTKKVLVDMLRKAGRIAPEGIAPAAPPAEVHPTRTEAFQKMTISKIGNAASVGDLELIRKDVVRQGGEQAWLPAYTEAARTRVAELDAGGVANPVYAAIEQCNGAEDLGKLWEEVTVGGKVPGNWTAAVQAAAQARLKTINDAQTPAPSNPFTGG